MAAMNHDLSAPDAARLLGVSPPTLYSYVSRGLLGSVSNGQSRRKRYPQEDVLRLAARKNDAKRGGQTATAAMHWGLPVLETQISQILDGRLLYRGCDATALAESATLGTTASLPAALGAGLAALSGDKHGGASAAARRMLTQALAAPDAKDAIGAFYKTIAPEFSGFGHPLYPGVDPRAAYLLGILSTLSPGYPQLDAIMSACATAGELHDAKPNADLALAAMELAFDWPARQAGSRMRPSKPPAQP